MTDIIAPRQRKLSDLYSFGVEVEFNDGEGEPIVVWVKKLNPGEVEDCVDLARPAKHKILSIKRLKEDDPAKFIYYEELESNGYTKESDYIDFILKDKFQEAFISARERVAAEEEWSKEGYLSGLQQVWNDELSVVWSTDPENEEAQRVYEELKRYTEKVVEEYESARNELVYEIQDLSLEALKRRAVNIMIEDHANNVMLSEFRKYQLFFAVVDPRDKSQKYFDSVEDIRYLPEPVKERLQRAFDDVSVDGIEGKDSEEAQAS